MALIYRRPAEKALGTGAKFSRLVSQAGGTAAQLLGLGAGLLYPLAREGGELHGGAHRRQNSLNTPSADGKLASFGNTSVNLGSIGTQVFQAFAQLLGGDAKTSGALAGGA